MIALLPALEQKRTTKKQLIDLEEKILCALEFGLHSAGPIPFLERYQRIFDLDQEASEHDFKQVGYTARQFCKYMQRFGQFLSWRPSQIAAAAFMLSINLNLSVVAPQVGLRPLKTSKVDLAVESLISVDSYVVDHRELFSGPLRFWSSYVAELTRLDAQRDISALYNTLMNHLDDLQFKGKLKQDSSLWVS